MGVILYWRYILGIDVGVLQKRVLQCGSGETRARGHSGRAPVQCVGYTAEGSHHRFLFLRRGASTTLISALVMRTFSTIADASNWRSFNTLKLSKGMLKRVWFKKSYYSVVRVKRGPRPLWMDRTPSISNVKTPVAAFQGHLRSVFRSNSTELDWTRGYFRPTKVTKSQSFKNCHFYLESQF